jgi:hypothetical protein
MRYADTGLLIHKRLSSIENAIGCADDSYVTPVLRYKEMSTKNTKDTKNRSDYADFIRFHFTKNAKVQLLFRAFRVFRGQELLMSNSGYVGWTTVFAHRVYQ